MNSNYTTFSLSFYPEHQQRMTTSPGNVSDTRPRHRRRSVYAWEPRYSYTYIPQIRLQGHGVPPNYPLVNTGHHVIGEQKNQANHDCQHHHHLQYPSRDVIGSIETNKGKHQQPTRASYNASVDQTCETRSVSNYRVIRHVACRIESLHVKRSTSYTIV